MKPGPIHSTTNVRTEDALQEERSKWRKQSSCVQRSGEGAIKVPEQVAQTLKAD